MRNTFAIVLLAVVALAAFAAALDMAPHIDLKAQKAFVEFMHKYHKTYHPSEFHQKYKTFKKNYELIEAHNKDETKTHKVAINQFADLTGEEFKQQLLGTKMDLAKHAAGPKFVVDDAAPAPKALDWRSKKVVTPVKNQGQCGSCWSFSTTGSTEACHAIKLGADKLVSLSEQNLIDCSVSYGNQGCNGGLMTDAFDYIIANKGLDTEASYPYTTSGPNTCEYSAANLPKPVATVSSYENVPSGNEKALLQAGVSGPVSVAIDASQYSFQFYSSGVYYEPECSSTALDHGVLMVGWGTDATSGSDYWIVKNSWGESWGQAGYIWMARNKQNNCGIATMATLPRC